MKNIKIGKIIKNFSFSATKNIKTNLWNYQGKKVLLFFYPKDNTPGCSIEIKEFSDLYEKFLTKNIILFGISSDSLEDHFKFEKKLNIPFALISDSKKEMCKYFNVIGEKKIMGKNYIGIIRSTFLIDKNSILIQEWRNVKAKKHAKLILDYINLYC